MTLPTIMRVGGAFPLPSIHGVAYIWTGAEHVIAIALHRVTTREIGAFENGEGEIALFDDGGPTAALLCRFGVDIPWMDTIFNIWNGGRLPRADADALLSQHVGENEHLFVNLALVERTTNTIRALRAFTLSPAFGKALLSTLHRQIEAPPIEDATFLAAATAYHARFPTTSDVLAAAMARTIGGA